LIASAQIHSISEVSSMVSCLIMRVLYFIGRIRQSAKGTFYYSFSWEK